jgi:cell division protein FtsB
LEELKKENERLQHELELAKLRKENRELQKEIDDLNHG